MSEQAASALPTASRRLELFEPAMCCSTGVCGPSADQQLITLRDDLRWIEGQGAGVTRHGLSSDPDAFVANPKVTGLMQAFGDDALPALLVDGEVKLHGRYPTRDELSELLVSSAPAPAPVELPQAESSCGCGPGGC